MKILTFTSLYPNNIWPDQGVFIQERMTRVAAQPECEVQVLAPVPYFPPLKLSARWRFSQVVRHEIRAGLAVYHPRYFLTPKIGMSLYGGWMFLSMLRFLTKIRESFDFDLIDAHFVYPDGFAAVLCGRFFAKPVVVSARGSDINLYKEWPIIHRLLRWTLSGADRVIAVSHALKDAMVQLQTSAHKIIVIPNGVDVEKFRPAPKVQARQALGLPDKRLLLSVGHLTAVKGFDLLIRALKILHEEYREKDLLLCIVGHGDARKDLEKVIAAVNLEPYVRLVGAVNHDKLALWYSAADLFCLASSREGWPNVLLESLACGTPVVAAAVGGMPEIICSDRLGLLTERSTRGIARSIAVALKKPWHTDTLTRYAREHSWERAAVAVLQTFTAVLEARGRVARRSPLPRETMA
jgi:glycosyltransferase involved in cell wall biosynthesis